jgi:hypothetical protein
MSKWKSWGGVGVVDAVADGDGDPLPAAPLVAVVPAVVRVVDDEVSAAPLPLPMDMGCRALSFTSFVCIVFEPAVCSIHCSAQNSAKAASTDCLAGMPPFSKAFAMFFFVVTGSLVLK